MVRVEEHEARAVADSMELAEMDMDGLVDARLLGLVRATPHSGDQLDLIMVARTGLTPQQRAEFTAWARQRVTCYLHLGPEADGWQVNPLGGWWIGGPVDFGPPDPFL